MQLSCSIPFSGENIMLLSRKGREDAKWAGHNTKFGTMRSAFMGLGLYGFSGYMGNFWADPNEMGFLIIKLSGYKG